jgi:hypothetical protein
MEYEHQMPFNVSNYLEKDDREKWARWEEQNEN